ncbi:MAG: hypothetical protein JRG84_06400 [Deltaproteobacteria bacterium]|nr:hypothetical protein [Deltaproteobacteria bacterium]
MPLLGRLLALPLQQLDAVMAETWSAFRGSSRFSEVPPLEPSFSLLGEALLDRTFTLTTSVMTGVPLPDAMRRALDEVLAAKSFYGQKGWLDDPASYHRTPPPLEGGELFDETTRLGVRRTHFKRLVFDSGFEPYEGEPGRERWLEHPKNHRVHAYVLEHDEPRPWLIGVHGFAMGGPLANFTAFNAQALHQELGLNVIMPVLPLHGPRTLGRFSGGELLEPDYLQMVHLFAQATWDVRRVISWVKSRSDVPPALYGISLGGYISALVASFEADLSCVIAGIPAVDFPNLARDNEPWIMQRYDDELRIDWDTVRAATHVVSPLALEPQVPHDRRFIYAGIADRVVQPDQPRALWRHWGHPEIHWFSGGHVLGVMDRSCTEFVARCLTQTGLSQAA